MTNSLYNESLLENWIMNGQEWKEIDRNEQQKLAKIKKKKKQNTISDFTV